MESMPFLTEFLLILVVATVVAVLFDWVKLPPILGFLLAGVAMGPHGFGLISNQDEIHMLAELGVVLLMLTIGLEFSFDRLKGLQNIAIVGGSLQVLISIGIGVLFGHWRGWTFQQGLFLGSVIALSSTAIVLKYLVDRGELDVQYGRISLAILLFQDMAVVPLLILIKGLVPTVAGMAQAIGGAFLKALILLGIVVIVAKYLLGPILHRVALRRNREVFFLTTVVIALGTAWLGNEMGLSYAIGAFFAGVMFANTEYGHQLLGEIVPFRYIFVSIFFVSIGLLFDISFTISNFWLIIGIVGLVLLVNFVVTSLLVMSFGYPPRVALAAGLILSQIGEFSFLLLQVGRESGKVDPFLYNVLLSTAFITMFITPFLFSCVPLILKWTEKRKILSMSPFGNKKAEMEVAKMENHIILCGFGPTGQDLATTFLEEGIPFTLLEMNPKNIQKARKINVTVIYGDAANLEVMKKAGVDKAKMVIISFRDPLGMAQIIRAVEQTNPNTQLVVRTRFEKDVPKLYEMGADTVIIEEWEASHELNRVVLDQLGLPKEKIQKHLSRIVQRKEFIIEESILGQIGKIK